VTSRARVVFVDDEARVLDGLRRSLRGRRGEWDMSFVTSGADALDLLAQEPHDVVVSDMRMPGMDGAELLTLVSHKYPEVARVVLSGQTELDAAIKVAMAGHRFLTKPVDVDRVAGIIAELTAGTEDPRAAEVRRIAGAVRSLPSPAAHVAELSSLLGPGEVTLASTVHATAHNVGLTAKFLQMATSPFFSTRGGTGSTDSVVNVLGLPTVRALLDTGEVLWSPPAWGPAVETYLGDVVRHAVATAHLVGSLASPGNRPYAQAAALLQDVGVFVCLADEQAYPLTATVPHREVGVELLRLWGLPAPIVSAVAERDHAHEPTATGLGISGAVRAAHLLIQRTPSRDPGDGVHEDELTELMAHPQLAVQKADWQRIADEAAERAVQWYPREG
jgi:DNA-binding NarL/FixJ family response regulator